MFELFGAEHVGVLAATVVAAAVFAVLGHQMRSGPALRCISAALAIVLIGNEFIWHAYQIGRGTWQVSSSLPLHLCDAAVLVSAAALLTRSPLLFELIYFWGLGGSVQALLTPALGDVGVPSYPFLRYFISHSGIVVAVAWLGFGQGLRPRPGCIRRVFAVTAAYAGAVGIVNCLLGANYMFLCAKPATPSLLDYLGPWPWYIAPLVAVSLGMMLLLYVPYYLADRGRRRTLCAGEARPDGGRQKKAAP